MRTDAAAAGARRAHLAWCWPVLAAASLASGAGWPVSAGAAGKTHRVVIQGLKYVPETLTVHAGDTVVWVNNDPFPHTVTAAGGFDSGAIEAGKSWRLVAPRAGAYPYVCALHANMKGSLQVQ